MLVLWLRRWVKTPPPSVVPGSFRWGLRYALPQAVSAVFSLQNREGLTQRPFGGHQNQVSRREFGAEDGQELSMEAYEKGRATQKGRNGTDS